MLRVLPKIRFSFSTSSKGFTLIELIIALGVIAVLLGILVARVGLFNRQVELDSATEQILSALRRARSQTLASENQTVYGVHFETDEFVIFTGNTYNSSATTNVSFPLSGTEIYEINLLGGGSEVIFNRIRGNTSYSGNIKVRLLSDTSRTKTIVIDSLGQASIEDSVSPTSTRVTDTRHLHFDLGWSIQSSNTLRFIFTDFPDPTVTYDVNMQNYFDPGKTVFSWSGTIDVNGEDQELRVHTHLIDGSNTILSVHRDRRDNDKALEIQIDGSTIVNYTDDGTATVGTSGGTMEQQ